MIVSCDKNVRPPVCGALKYPIIRRICFDDLHRMARLNNLRMFHKDLYGCFHNSEFKFEFFQENPSEFLQDRQGDQRPDSTLPRYRDSNRRRSIGPKERRDKDVGVKYHLHRVFYAEWKDDRRAAAIISRTSASVLTPALLAFL